MDHCGAWAAVGMAFFRRSLNRFARPGLSQMRLRFLDQPADGGLIEHLAHRHRPARLDDV
jgi:hypothetical protein